MRLHSLKFVHGWKKKKNLSVCKATVSMMEMGNMSAVAFE